jgi:hypothetical protein
VDVRVTPAAPSLSDVIRVDVTLSGTDDPHVTLRPPDIPSGCVTVTASSVAGNHAVVTLDPVKPGPCTIPPFRTRCLRGATEDCDVRSAETLISIGTVVANSDSGDADIRDSEETPLPLTSAPIAQNAGVLAYAWWGAVAIFLIVPVCGGIWIWRRRRKHPARRAARLLRGFRPAGADQAEAFSQLTVIFRDYLDQRLALGARCCTSPELLNELRRRSLSEGETARALRAFLEACDRAKFGGTPAEANEIDTAKEECLSLIQTLDFYVAKRSRAGV